MTCLLETVKANTAETLSALNRQKATFDDPKSKDMETPQLVSLALIKNPGSPGRD